MSKGTKSYRAKEVGKPEDIRAIERWKASKPPWSFNTSCLRRPPILLYINPLIQSYWLTLISVNLAFFSLCCVLRLPSPSPHTTVWENLNPSANRTYEHASKRASGQYIRESDDQKGLIRSEVEITREPNSHRSWDRAREPPMNKNVEGTKHHRAKRVSKPGVRAP